MLIEFFRRRSVQALSVLLLAHAAAFYALPSPNDTPAVAAFVAFPSTIGEWRTVETLTLEPGAIQVVQPDDYLYRTVERPSGSSLALLIGYFRTQRNGHMPHSPRNCLPAHGWVPVSRRVAEVTPNGARGPEQINVFEIQRQEHRQVVLYWYQTPSNVIAREWIARARLFGDAIAAGRTDTTLVRITAPVVNGDVALAEAEAVAFSRALIPAVARHLRTDAVDHGS